MIYNHPLFILLYKNYDGKVFYLVTSEEVKYNRKKYMVGGKMKENKYDDEPEKFITKSVEPKTLTIKELKKSVREIKSIGGDTRELLVEIGNRYSFPFSSFIISFLGLSLGSRYVRGASAISMALSVALGYGYYIVQASFEALSINGFLNPFISGWIPNIIFLGIGIYFMYRAEY